MNMEPDDSLLLSAEQETEELWQEVPDNEEEAEAVYEPKPTCAEGLETQTFPQQHLWCSTVHDKKPLQAGKLHMQSVRKKVKQNNLDMFFEIQ